MDKYKVSYKNNLYHNGLVEKLVALIKDRYALTLTYMCYHKMALKLSEK